MTRGYIIVGEGRCFGKTFAKAIVLSGGSMNCYERQAEVNTFDLLTPTSQEAHLVDRVLQEYERLGNILLTPTCDCSKYTNLDFLQPNRN